MKKCNANIVILYPFVFTVNIYCIGERSEIVM